MWYRIKELDVEWHFRDPKHKEVSCLCNTCGGGSHPHLSRLDSLEPAMELTILMARLKEALTLVGKHDD